ncbi:uncharacterized protein TNIN_197691 [Trichonephila inaurata madagascariensis]|uniref:Uncharacterized protein n=1 Tax=Trichonephila inaurata madagascariensis TaxID=2747483 RepID=A0A8X7BTZ9_9ARAC|nr:uncharacterized protein TNIN_197691 [Trichonephila inaurata madagascariensis]
MDSWLENGMLKKTEVVSSNAEIVESTEHFGTRNAIIFQFRTAAISSSNSTIFQFWNRWYQRKDVNMIPVTYPWDLLELVTRKLQMQIVCFATKY